MKRFSILLLLFFSFCSSGCGQKALKPEGLPDLFPCNITVTQDGSPKMGIAVMLYPENASITWPITGGTDAGGVAVMVTYGQFKGVPLGKYKVVLSKFAPGPTDDHPGFEDVEEKFRSEKTTPLELEITSGKVDYSIDAGKSVKDELPRI